MYRKRKKNDLSTRRLSFNNSIPDSPDKSTADTPVRNKKTPNVNNENQGRKRNSLKSRKTPSVALRKSQSGKRNSLSQTNARARNISTIQEESDFEIKDLLKKRWKIYQVSPLYNFQESKLKTYGKKFCEELCSVSHKFDYDTNFTSLKASFSITEGFNPFNDESYALQVKLVTNNNRNNYIGYFISWESKKEDEHFVSLPILLARGNKGIRDLVHKSICKFFDCDVLPMQLSLRMLVIHLAKYLETVKGDVEDTALLSLQYRLPGFNQKNSITITLSALDTAAVLILLLNQIEGPNANEMKMVLYETLLYQKLLVHILRVYQFNLTNAELFKVVYPQAILTSDGEINWASREMVMLGLSLLQEFISLD